MIYSVCGKLLEISDEYAVIETGGIGYRIFIADLLKEKLPSIGEEIKLYTYHHVREDQQALYGFLEVEDKNLFLLLMTVSGVGAKLAQKILSAVTRNQLINAILTENLVAMTNIPGVGKKTAERIIIELKDKLPKIYDVAKINHGGEVSSKVGNQNKQLEDDLSMALKTLGYSNEEIKRALTKASTQISTALSLEEGVKILLRYL